MHSKIFILEKWPIEALARIIRLIEVWLEAIVGIGALMFSAWGAFEDIIETKLLELLQMVGSYWLSKKEDSNVTLSSFGNCINRNDVSGQGREGKGEWPLNKGIV